MISTAGPDAVAMVLQVAHLQKESAVSAGAVSPESAAAPVHQEPLHPPADVTGTGRVSARAPVRPGHVKGHPQSVIEAQETVTHLVS